MPKYRIYCTWSMYGGVEIEAANMDDAIDIVDDMPLADIPCDYGDGTWEILYNQCERIDEISLKIPNQKDIDISVSPKAKTT